MLLTTHILTYVHNKMLNPLMPTHRQGIYSHCINLALYRPFAMGGARTYVVMVNVVVAILSVKRAPKLLTVID